MDEGRREGALDDGVAPEDVGIDRPMAATIQDVIATRLGRRDVLRGLAAIAVAAAWPGLRAEPASAQPTSGGSTLTFTEIPHGLDDRHHVAPGYSAEVLIRWGDPVLAAAPPFDAARLDRAAQARQFGYNNDFLAYMPLPRGSQSSEHGLLCVNHEYTNTELMFAGFTKPNNPPFGLTTGQAGVDQAAHGLTVVEVRKTAGRWAVVVGGPLQPPLHDHGDGLPPGRPCRRARPAAHGLRPLRHHGPRHAQQLRRRRHAVGHRALRGRELQRLLPG